MLIRFLHYEYCDKILYQKDVFAYYTFITIQKILWYLMFTHRLKNTTKRKKAIGHLFRASDGCLL